MSRRHRAVALLLAAALVASSGCTQAVWLLSKPSRAKVWIDGKFAGETPLLIRPSHHLFASMDVLITKEGYVEHAENLAAWYPCAMYIAAGVLILPLPWIWQYRDEYNFTLKPVEKAKPEPTPEPSADPLPLPTFSPTPLPAE